MTERTNPYRSPDDRSQVGRCSEDGEHGRTVPATGVTFLVITIALLLMAVAVSLMQKRWEGHVGIGFATQMPTAELTDHIDKARKAQVVSLSIVSLSLVTWCMAFYRHEANRVLQFSVSTLLTLFVVMQLLVV